MSNYTPLPWTARPSAIPNVFGFSTTTAAVDANSDALMQELCKAHAALRESELRNAEVQLNCGDRIRQATLRSEHKNKELLRELQQSQKREKALHDVAMNVYEEKQKLATQMQELKTKTSDLEALATKIKEDEDRLQKEIRDWHEAKKSMKNDLDDPVYLREATAEAKKRMFDMITRPWAMVDLFNAQDFIDFNHEDSPASSHFANLNLELLRQHDYYKGWTDGVRSMHHEEATRGGLTPESSVPQPENLKYIEEPLFAGANAGALFTWGALCQRFVPGWTVSIHEKQFDMASLKCPPGQEDKPFWKGFAAGSNLASSKFWNLTSIL